MDAPIMTAEADSRVAPEVVQRLDDAVRNSGGPSAVARQSGIPLRTVQNYLAGRGLKLGPLIALAEATGVRFEWLATGRGPMKSADFPAPEAQIGPSAGERPPIDRLRRVIDDMDGPAAVAERSGVPIERIARYLQGAELPLNPDLVAIASACNVSLDWLATGTALPGPHPHGQPNLAILATFFDLSKSLAKEAGQELSTHEHLQRAWHGYFRMQKPE